MKLIPVLLLNVATVTASLAVYDQVRSGSEAPPVVGEGPILDRAALEKRVAALEAQQRPALRGAGTDLRLFDRLDALEDAVQAKTESDGPRVRAETPVDASRNESEPFSTEASPEVEPSPEEIRRFRRLQGAVRRQERMEKNAARIDKALDKLSLNLSQGQRTKIQAAFTDFQPRVGQIWGEIKDRAQETLAAGGSIDRQDLGQQGMAQIQQEFAQALDGIVAPADAEVIATAMHPGQK